MRIGPRRPIRRRGWIVLVLAALVLSAAVIGVRVAGTRHADAQRAAREVVELAPDRVVALLSYTPSTVLTDLDREAAWLSDDFRAEHGARVRERIAPAVAEGAVAASAEVKGVAVSDAARDQVDLVVFVDVTTTTSADDGARLQGARLDVRVVRESGRWLVDAIDPV